MILWNLFYTGRIAKEIKLNLPYVVFTPVSMPVEE